MVLSRGTTLLCHLSLWGQHRDVVLSLIHFSLRLRPFIYYDLKSQAAFSVLFCLCVLSVLLPSGPFSATPDPVFSKVVWSSDFLLALSCQKRRTRCNFLLISSSPLLRKRAPLLYRGREREWRTDRKRHGERQEAGLWLPPIRLPFPLCLYLPFPITCSLASVFLSLSCSLHSVTLLI